MITAHRLPHALAAVAAILSASCEKATPEHRDESSAPVRLFSETPPAWFEGYATTARIAPDGRWAIYADAADLPASSISSPVVPYPKATGQASTRRGPPASAPVAESPGSAAAAPRWDGSRPTQRWFPASRACRRMPGRSGREMAGSHGRVREAPPKRSSSVPPGPSTRTHCPRARWVSPGHPMEVPSNHGGRYQCVCPSSRPEPP